MNQIQISAFKKTNLRTHMGQLGLRTLYGTSSSFQYLFKLILALTYVPMDKVSDAYKSVVLPQLRVVQDEPWYDDYQEGVDKFMAYHTSTYLGRGTGPQRKEPFFPISSWNKYDDVLNDRRLTNNTVEVFNRNWTDSMERTPSLYSVIEGFIRQVNQVNVNNKFLFLFVYLAYQIMIKYL